MAIDRPDQRTVADTGLLDPRLNIAYRARSGVRAIRYADLASDALLIRLGPAQRYRQAVLRESAVVMIEADEFRPAKRTSEPEQD